MDVLYRDFANGFMYAEVLSRYFPADVQMHSFENVASTERKRQNWQLLEKLFKVSSFTAVYIRLAVLWE